MHLFNYQAYPPDIAADFLRQTVRAVQPGWGLLALLLMIAGLQLHVPRDELLHWLPLIIPSTLFWLWLARYLRRADLSQTPLTLTIVRRAEWRITGIALMHGAAVGSMGLLMEADQTTRNMTVVLLYCAGASGVGISEATPPARIVALMGSAMLSFSLGLYLSYPGIWPLLCAVLVLFTVATMKNAIDKNRNFVANWLLRRENERLLQQYRVEAERANRENREKSAFLAAASHDLRQPLHALMLTSHALSLQLQDDEARILVDRIGEAGQALSDQFNHLMDLSRLESGNYKVRLTVVSVSELLHRVAAAHWQTAERKGVELRTRLDYRLRRHAMHTDAGLVGRVLHNLVDNAVKFSDRGGRVLVVAQWRPQGVRFSVLDRGIGIAPAQREQIFKPYMQVGNPARNREHGIGLGLSIAREAAALLGAEIRLRSRLGHGSRFSFMLDAPLSAEPYVAPQRDPLAPAKALWGRTLLVVEDDAMAGAALSNWAEQWGLNVTLLVDPQQVAAQPPPDLIVCDVRLPGPRDGIDWLGEWLTQWPDARGVLVSGETSLETHHRAEHEGFVLLGKPVDPQLLLRTLAGFVTSKSA